MARISSGARPEGRINHSVGLCRSPSQHAFTIPPPFQGEARFRAGKDQPKVLKQAIPLSAILLAGCATVPQQTRTAPESVTFEETACFGSCPIFSITLNADGSGVFEGTRFVAAKGEHRFTAKPAQVKAFLARIEPFRPEGIVEYGYDNCSVPVRTDSPSVRVTWQSEGGAEALSWYLGCAEPKAVKIKPDLYGAWKELPLDELVGTKENRFEYEPQGR
ncbi:DUF6438 domain-containing protein [Erythrobacter sp. SG61-1L]|uniref:DUF6438 domain-containing protein n=1 Tax=Erythrobacter sp. SG61-1L TaxID=1603897 RepID=UPI00138F4DC9|nr:DUF6438 domain-containing protein [Erythrobacter sp. SG61-1L]